MKNENKSVKREIRLNVNFLDFVCLMKKEKLVEVVGEKIGEMYEKEMGLVFNNVKRVYSRVKRDVLNDVLVSELEKRNMSKKEFLSIGEKIVNRSKKKSDNYLSVKI